MSTPTTKISLGPVTGASGTGARLGFGSLIGETIADLTAGNVALGYGAQGIVGISETDGLGYGSIVALGNAVARGAWGVAIGNGATSASNSLAVGAGSSAATYSTALGAGSTATGDNSLAINGHTPSSTQAVALGTTAYGSGVGIFGSPYVGSFVGDTAIGVGSFTTGLGSGAECLALGAYSSASSGSVVTPGGIAIGQGAIADQGTIAIRTSTSGAVSGTAIGNLANIAPYNGFNRSWAAAIGPGAGANLSCVAIGDSAVAGNPSGSQSVAIGYGTYAENGSVSIGVDSTGNPAVSPNTSAAVFGTSLTLVQVPDIIVGVQTGSNTFSFTLAGCPASNTSQPYCWFNVGGSANRYIPAWK